MPKIILIQPNACPPSYSHFLRPILRNIQVPFSLLRVASLVEREYEIKIIDQRMNSGWEKDLLKELNNKPLCVGINVRVGMQLKYGIECSKFIKEKSNVPVVWGGLRGGDFILSQAMNEKYVDIIVDGEGEITFYELVNTLKNKENLEKVKGIWFRSNGNLIKTPLREPLDLNILPPLPYHLLEMGNYIKNKDNFIFLLESSRGCPHRCSFCFNNRPDGDYRIEKADKVLATIEDAVTRFGVKYFKFLDGNLFGDVKRAREIINGIIVLKKRFSISWDGYGVSLDFLSILGENFINSLSISGCTALLIGIESGCRRILDIMNKNSIDLNQVLQVNKLLKQNGINVCYTFIAGTPTEKIDELKETISLINNILMDNPNRCSITILPFYPLPDTKLFDLALRLGFKPPVNIEGWITFFENSTLPWLNKRENYNIKALNLTSFWLGSWKQVSSPIWLKKIMDHIILSYKTIAKIRVRKLYFRFFFLERVIGKFFNKIVFYCFAFRW